MYPLHLLTQAKEIRIFIKLLILVHSCFYTFSLCFDTELTQSLEMSSWLGRLSGAEGEKR